MPSTVAYDAFISYSHRGGDRLGPALRATAEWSGKLDTQFSGRPC
jgi:hypothetical protein